MLEELFLIWMENEAPPAAGIYSLEELFVQVSRLRTADRKIRRFRHFRYRYLPIRR